MGFVAISTVSPEVDLYAKLIRVGTHRDGSPRFRITWVEDIEKATKWKSKKTYNYSCRNFPSLEECTVLVSVSREQSAQMSRKELVEALKEYKKQSLTTVKLNAKTVVLEDEYRRLCEGERGQSPRTVVEQPKGVRSLVGKRSAQALRRKLQIA